VERRRGRTGLWKKKNDTKKSKKCFNWENKVANRRVSEEKGGDVGFLGKIGRERRGTAI